MEHVHHVHRHRHARRGGAFGLSAPSRTTVMEQSRVLVARSTCTNDSDAGCEKPTSVPTLAIALAVVIPVVIAAAVLFYLHRRNIRRLREEDANDKYKSLDFGIDPSATGKKKGRKAPEMALADTEKEIRGGHGRGISLDMEVGSPYILPAGLHGSRESFHSLSRSQHDSHDPYRPVTFVKDDASIRTGNRPHRQDTGSLYTTSSGGTQSNRMNDGLLKNAQRMSRSYPHREGSMSPQDRDMPEIRFPEPVAVPLSPLNPRFESNIPQDPLPPPPPPPVAPRADTAIPSIEEPQNSYTAFKPNDPAPVESTPESGLPPLHVSKAPTTSSPSPPPRVQSQTAVVQSNPNTTSFMSDSSYGEGFQVTPPSPTAQEQPPVAEPAPLAPQPRRPAEEGRQNRDTLAVDALGLNTNRLSMSLRPLPPDDPNDNPEQRANRIRSFYKEYFDDSKPEPAGGHIYNEYYEDYGSEYLDGAVFDPETGNFVIAQAPFAQPVTRRAMTPPPRAPPRFRSNTGPRGPHMSGGSMSSGGRFMPPRGMSSMSGRLPAPRRPLAPPTPLSSLPTPAKLKEDSMVFNPIDFAPPVSFRERQNGMRPDSPLGSPRPFSPAVRPHTPLASSFDDLAVMPSPHALRKSGTFTALDFAPPPRFRDPGSNASDAGSIRSNRSGMSSNARVAVRNGAYRVSRIPKEVVGTRDDILTSLRPQMNLTAPA